MSLVWLDLETTGLAPDKCKVLEVAAIATDDALNEVARFQRVIYFDRAYKIAELLQSGTTPEDVSRNTIGEWRIDPFVIEMHQKNGLWADCVHGQARDTVDRDLAAFIREHAQVQRVVVDEATGVATSMLDKPQLAGSTISFDRGFLAAHLPLALAELHYRNLDVSTLNETGRRFWPEVYAARPRSQDKAHRGMADIQESIAQFKHYLANIATVSQEAA